MLNIELKALVEKLVADTKVLGLVKMMQPVDVVAIISKDLDLFPDEAERVTSSLLHHAHNCEGMSSPGIESNKKYPVPEKLRKKDIEEYINIVPKYDFSRYHFPPDPVDEPGEWPYDDMTKAAIDPKNKSRKRPLMQGPLDTDLRKNQPGGDGAGGKGIYSKNAPHNRHNSTPSGRSWDRKGTPGWSSSPQGKEFSLPGEENPPVGAPIPKFFGGHSEPRKHGERTGFRRR